MDARLKTAAEAPQASPGLKRRHALLGGLLAAGSAGLTAQTATGTPAAASTASTATAPLPLTAQTTEGPYHLPGMPLRSDITEGLPGVPMELRLLVLDAQGRPQPLAEVDVWQCDATGLYSGFDGQGDDQKADLRGRTFLRGRQCCDAQGAVTFRTVYPGWYAGRTTHIHVKVLYGARAALTSQFFLPDAVNEFLYTRLPPYQRALQRNVINRTDGIAMRAGDTVLGTLREAGDRYVASLTLVVDPQADPPPWRPGGPPPPGARGSDGPPPGFGGRPLLPVPQGEERVRAVLPGAPT
jgi:protocatechuate 3,4-dioxygenase beta subunit